jgi:disease resistance protein RPS2
MNGCGEKEFPSGILPKLSHLQVFVLEEVFEECYAPITIKGKEVVSLRNLETLECHFEGLSDFIEFLRCRDGIQSLSTYRISVGILKFLYGVEKFPSKTVALGNLSINKDRDFQALYELFWQRANSLLHMVAQFDLNDKKKGKKQLKGNSNNNGTAVL